MAKRGKYNEVSSTSGVDEHGREATSTRAGTQREKSVSLEALCVAVCELGQNLESSSIPSLRWRVLCSVGLKRVKQNSADLDSRFI